MTIEDIETEYWAYRYDQEPDLDGKEVSDDDFDLQAELAKLENTPDDWETIIDGN